MTFMVATKLTQNRVNSIDGLPDFLISSVYQLSWSRMPCLPPKHGPEVFKGGGLSLYIQLKTCEVLA